MVGRNNTLTTSLALAALAFVLSAAGFGLLPLLHLGWAQGATGFTPYLWSVLRFTLVQAALSTLIALTLGLFAARALARRQFPGRTLLLRLMLLPQALPAIVVILSLLALFGNSGYLSGVFPVYGLSGILLAHVFFNAPLATRMLLTRYETIPQESYRLAEQLRLGPFATFRHVEWPATASTLKAAGGLIFLLCTASFAVVLVLGGGPQATTLEVAIYQSLRMDFNPGFAALLSLAQVLICAVAMLVAGRNSLAVETPASTLSPSRSPPGLAALLRDAGIIIVLGLLLLPPLVALFAAGVAHITQSPALWSAVLTSGTVALLAATLALLLGALLALLSARTHSPLVSKLIGLASLSCLLLPPAVIATGWFVMLAPHTDVGRLAPALVIALNALVALPFVRAIVEPALRASFATHDRLCQSLGIEGTNRLRLIELPVLRPALQLAAVMAFILSLGDLAAITLFGNAVFVTLPALVYRQMGHYQMNEAHGTALVLAVLTLLFSTLLTPAARPHDQR